MNATAEALRERVIEQVQGAAQLQIAYVGVATGLLDALRELGAATAAQLAEAAHGDAAYVVRWADAAYAFELLERDRSQDGEPRLCLSALGRAFCRAEEGSLMPFAVQSVLGAHMLERAATFTRTGERPGEGVLAERESILPLFGPMLEQSFGPLFERVILGAVPVFGRVAATGGLVVDLGCGNGWYLRRLAARHPGLRGVGIDGFEENVRQASRLAACAGLGDRLSFVQGDLQRFTVDEPVALIAMNRSLHHVWGEHAEVFRMMRERLAPGGAAVIWEPAWPADTASLRLHPRLRAMALQNLAEHVQGNRFLRPEEIAAALQEAGMDTEVHRFVDDTEVVVVGARRP